MVLGAGDVTVKPDAAGDAAAVGTPNDLVLLLERLVAMAAVKPAEPDMLVATAVDAIVVAAVAGPEDNELT